MTVGAEVRAHPAAARSADPVLLAVGASRGGVADVFQRTLLELHNRRYSVRAVPLPQCTVPAWGAVIALVKARRLIRSAPLVHLELGSNDTEVFWFACFALMLRRDCVVVVHDFPKIANHPSLGLLPFSARRARAAFARLIALALDQLLIRALVRRSGVLAVFGHEARNSLVTKRNGPVVVVPHGTDPGRGGSVPPSEGRYVLFAGYLSPHKGLDSLISAWERIGPDVNLQLIVAGEAVAPHTEWSSALEQRAGALPNPPRFVGRIPDEDALQSLIGSAALVVLPYLYSSPASGILVRAMASGRAVITTPTPAARSIVVQNENALVVPMDDVNALSEALERLISSPEERDRLGLSASSATARRFTWSHHIAALEEAYDLARNL